MDKSHETYRAVSRALSAVAALTVEDVWTYLPTSCAGPEWKAEVQASIDELSSDLISDRRRLDSMTASDSFEFTVDLTDQDSRIEWASTCADMRSNRSASAIVDFFERLELWNHHWLDYRYADDGNRDQSVFGMMTTYAAYAQEAIAGAVVRAAHDVYERQQAA